MLTYCCEKIFLTYTLLKQLQEEVRTPLQAMAKRACSSSVNETQLDLAAEANDLGKPWARRGESHHTAHSGGQRVKRSTLVKLWEGVRSG